MCFCIVNEAVSLPRKGVAAACILFTEGLICVGYFTDYVVDIPPRTV